MSIIEFIPLYLEGLGKIAWNFKGVLVFLAIGLPILVINEKWDRRYEDEK